MITAQKIDDHVKDIWIHRTPDAPKLFIVRPMVESENISTKDQCECQWDIGMLLYLVKHSSPYLANAIRELSKVNNNANSAAYKELLHVIKYVLDMKKLNLKIEPTGNANKSWEIICFSNYTGHPVNRRSIRGFTLYVLDVPVSCQSKSQKSISLSSSEAEYVALSEAVKEVMFVIQLLGCMMISNKYLFTVRIDNICEIFVTSIITTMLCTMHMDIRYKYANE